MNKDYIVTRYKVNPDASIESLEIAVKKVMMALQPLPVIDIEERLKSILLLVTLPASFDGSAAKAKFSAIAQKLSEFPADIVVEAINTVEETCKFIPSYAEFIEHIKPKYYYRKMMLEELHKCIALKYIV